MKLFVPYTEISEATEASLVEHWWTPIRVGKTGDDYSKYFRERWERSDGFINHEQDVVGWAGSVRELYGCLEPWCAFDYHLYCHQTRNINNRTGAVPLGLMKVSANLISATPDLWKNPVNWEVCDKWLSSAAWAAGFECHQHFPNVVNANPVFLQHEWTKMY